MRHRNSTSKRTGRDGIASLLLVLPWFLIVEFATAQVNTESVHHDDLLDSTCKRLAGIDATDCGRARFVSDAQVDKCALKASATKKPFRARYDLRGMDSSVAIGIVGTAGGDLYEVNFDSDPSGGILSHDNPSSRDYFCCQMSKRCDACSGQSSPGLHEHPAVSCEITIFSVSRGPAGTTTKSYRSSASRLATLT